MFAAAKADRMNREVLIGCFLTADSPYTRRSLGGMLAYRMYLDRVPSTFKRGMNGQLCEGGLIFKSFVPT